MRWRPPIVMVSSACVPASSLILLSSAARSWLPGWYWRTGSLAGTGTVVTPSITAPDNPTSLAVQPMVARPDPAATHLPWPAWSIEQIGQFLNGVPEQFIPLRAVHDELGVLVAAIGRGQRRDR